MTMTALAIDDLFHSVGVPICGVTAWGSDIPSSASGVYVIEVSRKTRFKVGFEIEAPFWNPEQTIVYIGRARNLQRRLKQFRRHRYGRSAPHRGGQAILTLDGPLTIHWSEVDDYARAEDQLIRAFVDRVGRMPFGNRLRSAQARSSKADSKK